MEQGMKVIRTHNTGGLSDDKLGQIHVVSLAVSFDPLQSAELSLYVLWSMDYVYVHTACALCRITDD